MPLIHKPVIVSLFNALEKLVEMEPLPTPFCGMVNSYVSSNDSAEVKPFPKLAVIDGENGVPLVR